MKSEYLTHAQGREAPAQVLYHRWQTDHREWAVPAVASDLYPLQAAALVRRSVGHDRICSTAAGLCPGEVLEVHSDHDVAPLLERVTHGCAELVSPQMVRSGPAEWVVDLTRMGGPAEDGDPVVRTAGPTPQGAPTVFDLRQTAADDATAVARILDAAAALRPMQSMIVFSRRPLPIYTLLAVWGIGHETHRLPDGVWKATFARPDERGHLPDLTQGEHPHDRLDHHLDLAEP